MTSEWSPKMERAWVATVRAATWMTAGVSSGRREAVLRDHALGRFNTPDAAAAFLLHLHERMPHTSGQVFRLDSRVG